MILCDETLYAITDSISLMSFVQLHQKGFFFLFHILCACSAHKLHQTILYAHANLSSSKPLNNHLISHSLSYSFGYQVIVVFASSSSYLNTITRMLLYHVDLYYLHLISGIENLYLVFITRNQKGNDEISVKRPMIACDI